MLDTKDKQIEHFFSSEHDTKTLLSILQDLMRSSGRSTGGELGTRFVPENDALSSGLERRGGER